MDASLNTLKKAISKSKVVDRRQHAEVVQQIPMLLAHDLSAKSYKKLVHGLRQSLVPIYSAYTLPAMQFSASIFHSVYQERILAALSKQMLEEKRRWEDVLSSLLSGILDFLDETESDKGKHIAAKDAVATALYPTLCDICFSLTAPMQSVDLRCTAYTLLSDTAASYTANQQKLRDKTILGGERLGSMVWRTKDYLALEALLTLFARILPSTKDSHAKNSKRTAYIQTVFMSPQHSEHASVGQAIVKLLEQESSKEWEATSQRVVETLAAAYLAFPQPFPVNEVKACDETKRCDKLYVDDKALLVNVLIGDDQCEALEVPYTTMCKIEVVPKQAGGSIVKIRVTTPPVARKVPVKSSSSGPLRVEFTLADVDAERFRAAVQSRKIGRLLKDTPPKLSLARSPARLDFDDQGKPVKELSQTERVENVEKFYRTNQQSSDDVSVVSLQAKAPEPEPAADNLASVNNARPISDTLTSMSNTASTGGRAKPSSGQVSRIKETTRGMKEAPAPPDGAVGSAQRAERDARAAEPATQKEAPSAGKSTKPLGRTRSAQMRVNVFGASDEELSEVDDEYDEPPAAPTISRTKVTTTKGPKPPVRSTTTMKDNAVEQKLASSTKARSGAARRVLDSDDEEAGKRGSADTMSTGLRSVGIKKKRVAPPTPDISDVDAPDPLERSFVTPPRSQVNSAAAPVTPTKPLSGRPPTVQEPSSPALSKSDVLVTPDAEKTLPKNDRPSIQPPATAAEHAAEPVVAASSDMPRSVSRKTTQQLTGVASADAETSAVNNVLTERTANTEKDTRRASVLRTKPKPPTTAAAVPTNLEISAHVMNSSSPVPVVKPGHSSVKAKLRKKGQTLASDKAAAHVKTSKRKRGTVDHLEADDEDAEPPPKKPRAEGSPLPKPLRSRRTDSRILRPSSTAATRVTQQYRAKKEKVSSPVSKADVIDYDELPNSTTSDARVPSSPTSSRLARRAKKEDDKRETELPVRATRRTAKVVKEKTMEKIKDEPPFPSEPTPPVEDGGFPVDELLGREEIADEEEVTTLLTKPSKPSVTIVQTPVVEAMKASAASTASKMNPFVEPTIASTSKAKGRESVSKTSEVKRTSEKKSNKMPWLVATTPADGDSHKDPPSADKRRTGDPGDKVAKPKATAITLEHLERKSALGEVAESDSRETLRFVTEQEAPDVTCQEPTLLPPQVETIDLTADDSPVKPKSAPPPVSTRHISPVHQPGLDDTLVNPPPLSTSTPFRTPRSAPMAMSTAKSARCVTFAPNVEERPSPGSPPAPLARGLFATSEKPAKQAQGTKHHDRPQIVKSKPTKLPPQALPSEKQTKVTGSSAARIVAPRKDAGMDDIVEVLEELQQALLYRITQKFEGVKEEVRYGRNTLLSEAYDDLLEMRNQSVVHFNRLIDLEAEYAKLGRLLSDGYDQLAREGQDVCSGLGRMVSDHDRGSLIKRMPVELSVLPACLCDE